MQLDRGARGRVPAKSKVLVRELVDGTLHVVHVASDGQDHVLRWTPAVPRTGRPASDGPPIPSVSPPPPTSPREPRSSPLTPDHPWRQQQRRWVDRALEQRAWREAAAARSIVAPSIADSEPPHILNP